MRQLIRSVLISVIWLTMLPCSGISFEHPDTTEQSSSAVIPPCLQVDSGNAAEAAGASPEDVGPAGSSSETERQVKRSPLVRTAIIVLKTACTVVLVLFGHVALCFYAGRKIRATRGKNCLDCCFYLKRKCSLERPWSMPFRSLARWPMVGWRFCPFCYHSAKTDSQWATSEFSGEYLQKLGISLLGVIGVALGALWALSD